MPQSRVFKIWFKTTRTITPHSGRQDARTDLNIVPGATRATLQVEVSSHSQFDGVTNQHIDVPHTLCVGWVVGRVVWRRQNTHVALIKSSTG